MEDNNRDKDYTNRGEYNQSLGRELYNKDRDQGQQQRYGYRGAGNQTRNWDEGNHFHTGPSQRGAQDRYRSEYNYNRGGSSNSSYNQGQNAHLNDHYGSKGNSFYKNERDYLNHGDRNSTNSMHRSYGNAGGQQPGNYNEPVNPNDTPHRESPNGRSRYKETDYRYGSGSHNWYRENRYSPDEDRSANDNRGFFNRMGDSIKDTWNDIMHADDASYQNNRSNQRNDYDSRNHISSRQRYGSEPYRDRGYDNGYDRSRDRGFESGPRWADETDSGEASHYNDTNRNERYRR